MKKKILAIGIIAMLIAMLIVLTGCGNSKKEKVDDQSALNTIRNAINKVYENNETLTTRNVQKYMVGNWKIVQAPADNTRNNIPTELDESTADEEWTTMFITAYNSVSNLYKDLKIMKSSDDGKLFVGSESGAVGAK